MADKELGDKIKRILTEKGMTQKELAARVGKTYEHLNATLKGRASLYPPLIKNIAEALDMTPEELMNYGTAYSPSYSIQESGGTYGQQGIKSVPFLEMKREEDGEPRLRASDITAPICFRTDWLYERGDPDSMVFVRTMGDSLEGELPDGSMVLVDRSQNKPTHGGIFFVLQNDEFRIRKILLHNGRWLACNDTESVQPGPDTAPEDDVRILGRCVWYGKDIA